MRITGADTLARELKDKANLQDVKNVVRLNSSEMQTKMQRKVPVDTGTLKRSINFDILDGGYTGRIYAHTEYMNWVEWGTRKQTAQPYFRPSFHEVAPQFKKDMDRLLK